MIDNTNEMDKGLESALKALEQAKARVANKKKKQNEKKLKAENHHRYMMAVSWQNIFQQKMWQRKNAAVSVKNEIMEMIAKVRERKNRLDLPIVSGKYLRKISDRSALQSTANAEVIGYNRKNLERELQNESRQQSRKQSKVRQREEI